MDRQSMWALSLSMSAKLKEDNNKAGRNPFIQVTMTNITHLTPVIIITVDALTCIMPDLIQVILEEADPENAVIMNRPSG